MPFSVLYCPAEQASRDRVRHTVLEPGLVTTIPGVPSPQDVVAEIRAQFPQIQGDAHDYVWITSANSMCQEDVAQCQLFCAEQLLKQRAGLEQGPSWRPQQVRAAQLAAFGTQRPAGGSKRCLGHLPRRARS